MTRARQFTPLGTQRAREFLAEVRANPSVDAAPPDELLYDGDHAQLLPNAPDLRRQPLFTRRDAAGYLSSALGTVEYQIVDHAAFWSWVGMYLFTAIAPRDQDGVVKLSPLDETFVVHDTEQQSYQRRYRHYLWSAWLLDRQHGSQAAFLLDQPLTSFGDIADRVFSYSRIFNSVGIVQLILALYVVNGKQKPRFGRAPGGLRHLIRVLDQLERTYDVYGMTTESLLKILPPDFDAWKASAPST